MHVKLLTVSVATNGSGAYSGTTESVTGRVLQIRYVPDGSTPMDTGADLDMVGASTGVVIANRDNIGTSAWTMLPRFATTDETGTASLYAAGGEPVEGYICVANEGITVTIASGGATKLGTFYIWIG